MRILSTLFFLCMIPQLAAGQLFINELDTDTPSTDFKEIIEIKSETPNFSLNGYVVVLFNGSSSGGDASYLALDLDGYTTDVNGIFVMGGPEVAPVPQFPLFQNTLQNGADAVAIYQGDASDFPEYTLATTTNLIDALVYDTDDADDTVLMSLLGVTQQINEDENNKKTSESIQRKNDGTYEVKAPTPGMLNDGTGVQQNGILISTTQTQYTEGDRIDIVFSTETAVDSDLTFDVTVVNENFVASDYSGSLSVTISSGTNSVTNQILIIDDSVDEGDEVMNITFGDIPTGFVRLNDRQKIRIIDNDFVTANFGTPLSPTYGNVASTAPVDYYDSLEGLSDNSLNQGIQVIVADPSTVRAHTYADVIDILKESDQSPLNSNQVWLLYSEEQRPKLDFQTTGGSSVGKWNREHTYPRSRGGFGDIDADDIADGIDVFVTTKSDSLRHANSDAHGLRATDGPENSSRGNQDYGEYNGPTNNQGSWKGDVARGILFLSIRYSDLEVVSGDPANSTVGQLGDLDVLLDWHRNDPPDDFEMNRNNVVYNWQLNRNPFIDQPDLVEYIWGSKVGQAWTNTLSIQDNTKDKVLIYPNPSTDFLTIESVSGQSSVEIFNMLGSKLISLDFNKKIKVDTKGFAKGTYIAKIKTDGKTKQRKVVIW